MKVDFRTSVLVVEDSRTVRRMIKGMLTNIGLQDVQEAEDGTDAYIKMNARWFDLIISDWEMEPMSGFELLKKARAHPHYQKTPFIMVTSVSSAEKVAVAASEGVTHHLIKPYTQSALQAAIEQSV